MYKKKLLKQYLSNQSDKDDVLTSGQPSNTDSSLIYKDGKWVNPATTKSSSEDNLTL